MSRKRTHEITYLVGVYEGNNPLPIIIGRFKKRDKAERYLSDYLKKNDNVNRAFIEKSQSFFNDKRNMWDF